MLWLGAVTAGVYGPHAVHGGFLVDAWAIAATYEFAPTTGLLPTVDYFLDAPVLSPRPLYAVYLVGLHELLGLHMGYWLAWLGAMNVLMATGVYALLRELRFGPMDAGVVATLLLIFPAASSLRLWTAVVQAPLAIALAVFGLLIALRAFDARGPKAVAMHAASTVLLASSLLLYEIALPAMLAFVLVYRLRTSWRRAVTRWAVDCAVLVPIAVTVTRSPSSPGQVQDAPLAHAVAILEEARSLLTTVALPFGTDGWQILALVALVPATAILVRTRLDTTGPAREELGRWLAVVLGGLAVVVMGYSIYVFGIDYYSPLNPGIANRVNAVPSVGWVLIVYGLAMLVATLAFRGLPQARRLSSALAVATSALVAVGWLQSTGRDANAFEAAYRENQRILDTVQAAVPNPAEGTTIWIFGDVGATAPGIPVFSNTWDVESAVRLRYGDPTVTGYAAFPETTFACRREQIAPGGNEHYRGVDLLGDSRYGRTYFVDATTGRAERIDEPEQCRRAAAALAAR